MKISEGLQQYHSLYDGDSEAWHVLIKFDLGFRA